MFSTEETLEPHEELTSWEVSQIRSAAFDSPTPILDILVEDPRLTALLENYEDAREALTICAEAIASYCNLAPH